MVGRLLLEQRTQQALEFENKNRQFTKEEIFEDDQMVYLFASHSSALQTTTTKFLEVTLKDGSKGPTYSICTLMDYTSIYGKTYYESKVCYKVEGKL